MSFAWWFEKRASDQNSAELADKVDSSTYDTSDGHSVHSGRKNFSPRGRGGTKNKSSGQSRSGKASDQFSQEREFIPERMTHFQRWENSRYGGGGGSVF